MRLRILISFLSLVFLATACNNSKKHDNPDKYELENREEAMINKMQRVLLENLKECNFASNPNVSVANCPNLGNYRNTNKYNTIPTCKVTEVFFIESEMAAKYTDNDCSLLKNGPFEQGKKDAILSAPTVKLSTAMAFEVIPIEITNMKACYLSSENLLSFMYGEGKKLTCQAILLKNVAGISNTGFEDGKAHYGHVVIAPINPMGTNSPAMLYAERFKLAFDHIKPTEAPKLQKPRYGNTVFNALNYWEGYAHVTEMELATIRYPLRDLKAIDLRTGQPLEIVSQDPRFVFGTAKLKYGYDFRSYDTANLGWLTPNYLTEEQIDKYILSNDQEKQELYSRQIK